MDDLVEFRARRWGLSSEVGVSDPTALLEREARMRVDFTAPFSESVPMRNGASDVDEPWLGPFFTPELMRFSALWKQTDGSMQLLEVLAAAFPHPVLCDDIPEGHYDNLERNVMTENGRVWYASLMALVGGARLVILFPYKKDDRLVMYTQQLPRIGADAEFLRALSRYLEYDLKHVRRRVA